MHRVLASTGAAIAMIGAIGATGASAAGAGAACDAARPAGAYRPGGGQAQVPATQRVMPCRYDTGARALEPSLDFTRDGRIVFQAWELQTGAPDGAPPRPKVVRSNTSFTSWKDVSPTGPM